MLIRPAPPPTFPLRDAVQPIGLSGTHVSIMSPDANGSSRGFVSGITGSDVDEGTGLRFKTKSLFPPREKDVIAELDPRNCSSSL